jgi:hypothetical protein
MNKTDAKLLTLAAGLSRSPKSLNALRLRLVPAPLRPRAREEYQAGDGTGFAMLAASGDSIAHVALNLYPLVRRGIYEEAFMAAYTAGRAGSESLPENDDLEFLLSLCDRDRLMAAGDPLPEGERFTLYRGVGNGADMAAVRRVSWTGDSGEAAWFAVRLAEQYGSKDPAVFRLVVERRRVLAYTNRRREREFLIKVLRKDRPVRVEPMPKPRQPVVHG